VEWAAWIIDAEDDSALTPETFGAKPKQQINHDSRVKTDPAVLLLKL
jgi:hypothetical protein